MSFKPLRLQYLISEDKATAFASTKMNGSASIVVEFPLSEKRSVATTKSRG